ncbi:MAG: hypothetical protein KKD44_15360, partial [Proteobacteria bacterium]|nr:hypothetical protein [Pseudomonadota bacterium]
MLIALFSPESAWTVTDEHGRSWTNTDEHRRSWTNTDGDGRTQTVTDEHRQTVTDNTPQSPRPVSVRACPCQSMKFTRPVKAEHRQSRTIRPKVPGPCQSMKFT